MKKIRFEVAPVRVISTQQVGLKQNIWTKMVRLKHVSECDGLPHDFTILIAEDDRLQAEDLSNLVKCIGASVAGPCTTTSQAVQLLNTSVIDFAIVDLKLADSLSSPLMDEINKRGIPIAMITAYPESYQPTQIPACARLEKPLDYRELASLIMKEISTKESSSNSIHAMERDRPTPQHRTSIGQGNPRAACALSNPSPSLQNIVRFDRALSKSQKVEIADTLEDIESAVTRGYVAAHRRGSQASIAALERLLVTLLASTVVDGQGPGLRERRAAELAELLVNAVRETNRCVAGDGGDET